MRRSRLAAIVAASLLLTACGGGSSTDARQDAEPNKGLPVVGENLTYNPNTLVNNGEVIELELWTWSSDRLFQELADSYQEIHPNVDIQVVLQPWEDYWTRLPLELNGGGGPTLFNIHNSYHENIIGDLEPYDIPVEELAADYRGVDAHVIDGRVHYLDYGMMTGLIYYNRAMWQEAGLTDADIPQTWDQFAEVARRLTKREGDRLVQAGFNFNALYKEFTLGLPYQLGHNLMEADMRAPALDNEATLAVIQRFRDFYDVHGVGSQDFGPEAADSFGQGQSAMIYNWGHFYGTLQEDYPDLQFGTFRTPVPEAGVEPYAYDRFNGESTLGINSGASAEQKAVAQDFIRYYLTNSDFMKQISLSNSVFPLYAPLVDDPEVRAHPVVAAVGDLDRYVWPGPMPSTFEDSVDTMWQDILYNGVPPGQALTTAQQTIAADLTRSEFVSVENRYPFYAPPA
jgi:multiple sugar transport system substrate-binding protein